MGSRMARRLLDAGHELRVYNRSANSDLEALASKGATACESPALAVAGCELIITMLSNPEAVEAVAQGETGLLSNATRGGVWMDCSTVDPEFSRDMAAEAERAGLQFLDCPVAGSKIPAENGELIFLMGGPAEALERVKPVVEVLSRKAVHCGENGSGSSMKLVVNFMLAQSVLAAAESVRLGKSLGLGESDLLDTLLATPVAAPILQGLRPRFEGKDTEVHFPLKHMLKDLKLARQSLGNAAIMPLLDAGIGIYEATLDENQDQDFSRVYGR